jgi:phosphopantetheinyl transferase (holo-ACP synthase)
MIGNDVVDLVDADSRIAGHHPRFDARVFAPSERALIAAGPDGEHLRWLLWAAKESAYKAARRVDAGTVFSPTHFVVRLASERHAIVDASARTFDVDLDVAQEHVHAIARARDVAAAAVYSAVARLAPGAAGLTPGAAVRRVPVTTLARLLDLPEEDFAIERVGRVPWLRVRGRAAGVELSLSHHGRFVAFACRWPDATERA